MDARPGIGRAAWLVTLGVTAARILYLALLCPYELAADEAQYWDWSRPSHLSPSYYSKGPGVAWAIAASTRIFGESEGAVRLPAAISGGVMMAAVAMLAARAARDPRAALAAALACLAVPAYHATSMLMTIDAPFLACWALAALAAWTIHERAAAERGTLVAWLALGAAIGVGVLFKYTILLLVPGIALGATLRPRAGARLGWTGPLVAGVVAGAIASPVFIWNRAHGWPTLAHLLGHVGAAGGDSAGPARPFEWRWPLEFFGGQLGLVGPMLLVVVLALRGAWRGRAADARRWDAARFALALSAPILVFYAIVSFTTDAEGNWPVAGYLVLLAPAAHAAVIELARWRDAVARWRADPARPWRGFLRRRPETLFQVAWHAALSYGVAAAVGLASLHWLDRVPVLTGAIPYHRLSGHRDRAARIHAVIEEARSRGTGEPIIIADQYTRAALLAWSLPDRPAVASATSFLGGRRSSYDFFPDTSLRDPALVGRPAVLVGSTPARWVEVFGFERVEPRLTPSGKWPAVYLGTGFKGAGTR